MYKRRLQSRTAASRFGAKPCETAVVIMIEPEQLIGGDRRTVRVGLKICDVCAAENKRREKRVYGYVINRQNSKIEQTAGLPRTIGRTRGRLRRESEADGPRSPCEGKVLLVPGRYCMKNWSFQDGPKGGQRKKKKKSPTRVDKHRKEDSRVK